MITTFLAEKNLKKCFYQVNNTYQQITDEEAASILSPEETRGVPGDEDTAEDESSVRLEQVVHRNLDGGRNLL